MSGGEALYVRPRPAIDDVPNHAGADIVSLRQFGIGHSLIMGLANGPHIGLRQFGTWIISAYRRLNSATALVPHVLNIVGIRAKEQVFGSDAGAIITSVADKNPVRDFAVCKFPRKTMCSRVALAKPIDIAVSRVIKPPRPNPAITGLINLVPELLNPFLVKPHGLIVHGGSLYNHCKDVQP